jgi:hypothetical protein
MKIETLNKKLFFHFSDKQEMSIPITGLLVEYNETEGDISFYHSKKSPTTLIITVNWEYVENMNCYQDFENFIKNAELTSTAGGGNQDTNNFVVKEIGKSLVPNTEIAKIHAAGSDLYAQVDNAASSGTITLATNTLTNLTTSQNNTTFTLALGTATADKANEYIVYFATGATAPTVTFPANIVWSGSAPTITANKKYLFSFLRISATLFLVNYITY